MNTESNTSTRLLLISNSTLHGSGYLDHAASEIQDFLGVVKRVLFVPFALHDRDKYAAQARARFEKMGYELDSIHTEPLIGTPREMLARGPRPTRGLLPHDPPANAGGSDTPSLTHGLLPHDPPANAGGSDTPSLTHGLLPRADSKAVREAEAIFIGGGNTFRLLKALYDHDLLDAIRERVREGMPYIGSSAGSNVAAPTIRTTNDMPIVQPPSLDALGLVRFQINPHYLDADPNSTHKGETREERIIQFLEDNETPVVGLREGAMLRIENGKTLLKGSTGARIFRPAHVPVEVLPGTYLDEFLQ